jgi:hypothetical protein
MLLLLVFVSLIAPLTMISLTVVWIGTPVAADGTRAISIAPVLAASVDDEAIKSITPPDELHTETHMCDY